MEKILMVDCFSFTKECSVHFVNGSIVEPFIISDNSPQTILNTAKEKQVDKIVLWGPHAYCSTLKGQIQALDENFKVEVK